MKFLLKFLLISNFFICNAISQPIVTKSNEIIVGNVRVQALSNNLIRIEQRGPNGYEDRNTFTIVNRKWSGEAIDIQEHDSLYILTTTKCRIDLPKNYNSLNGIVVRLKNGKDQYCFKGMTSIEFIPGPVSKDQIWILRDFPRLIPPAWGATPPPENFKDSSNSGWDVLNNAEDVYVFILEQGRYEIFRTEFLKLTGPIPIPPLFAFGLWDSRYHPYTEETALQTIDTYRKKQIPLDMFVVDTDWRRGASHGYATNDSLFPDMSRFISRAHEKHVRLMYNDHPEAQTKSALDPSEFQYRWNGLTSLLEQGIDVWWYDRNWRTGLHEPMPGISKEVWGMRMYVDITQKFRPNRRPLIMSNVDGIDNGLWNLPSHPASHRFPIWWTGDQKSRWEFLEKGIANGVNSGIHRMMPYVNEDLGGHTDGNPDPEQYVRWIQYGVFSPITRLHCTRGLTRYPWDYGEEAERITSEYIRLRYRLLPTIYAAARRAYDDGTPIMKRCDLEWPDELEAKRDKQYLFGEDLLIAPIALSKTRDIALPRQVFQTYDGKTGLQGEYFDNQNMQGIPVFVRVDSVMNFIMGSGSPDPRIPSDHFSIRWTGRIHSPKDGGLKKLKVIADDGVRVWIDDSLVVDAWLDQAPTDYLIAENLEPDRFYSLRIEYFENAGGAHFQLIQTVDVEQVYTAWIPPGNWQDAWTGKILKGPETIMLNPVLWKCPIYVREGGIVFSLPQMQYTTEKPWTKVIIDAFVPLEKNATITRILYEDDGLSPDYQKNAYCKTPISLIRDGKKIRLVINKRQGNFTGATETRDWVIRLNLPQNIKPKDIIVNKLKKKLNLSDEIKLITQTEPQEVTMPFIGIGSKPRALAGPILQLIVHQRDLRKTLEVSASLE
jgi:hypothetical protein